MGQNPPLVVLAFSVCREYHWQLPVKLDPGALQEKASCSASNIGTIKIDEAIVEGHTVLQQVKGEPRAEPYLVNLMAGQLPGSSAWGTASCSRFPASPV